MEAVMRRLAVLAGAGLVIVGSVGSADAQIRSRHGYHAGGYGHHHVYGGYRRGWGGGGALAAGLIGGVILGSLAASAPAYGAYGYPADPYAYGPPRYGSYARPVYRARYGYGPPADVVYAAPHEIRGGYRTVYRDGRRVIVGPGYW